MRKTSLSVMSTDFFLKRNWGRPYRYVGSKNLSQIHVRIHKPVKKKVCNRKPRPSLWVPYWMLELREILTQRPKKLRVQGLDFLQPFVSLYCLQLMIILQQTTTSSISLVTMCRSSKLFNVGSHGVTECSKFRLMSVLQKVYCCIVLCWKCYRENSSRIQLLIQ